MSSRSWNLVFVVLLSLSATYSAGHAADDHASSLRQKPLVKRPEGRRYTTVLSSDAGALLGIISAVVLVEVEQSIKRHLLKNPHFLPSDAEIHSVDDFDIHLADYFDCMSGISSGSWIALYLSSRGGQGASRRILENPEIIQKYGVITPGSAEGLIVFYKEYASTIYPPAALDTTNGIPFDITNLEAPGTILPILTLDGLEQALGDLLGNTTLADVDTSLMVQSFDLATDTTISFVHNAFRDPPVFSAARLVPRSGPRAPLPQGSRNFQPDLDFDMSGDYYLADIGTASGAPAGVFEAKRMGPVGSNTTDLVMVDGAAPLENPALTPLFFVASETEQHNFENIAMLSVGAGNIARNRTELENSGALEWLNNFTLVELIYRSGLNTVDSLLDYIFYSNPKTRPYQYLRIQRFAQFGSEEAAVLSGALFANLIDAIEAIGAQLAEEHRDDIDVFVRDFVF